MGNVRLVYAVATKMGCPGCGNAVALCADVPNLVTAVLVSEIPIISAAIAVDKNTLDTTKVI